MTVQLSFFCAFLNCTVLYIFFNQYVLVTHYHLKIKMTKSLPFFTYDIGIAAALISKGYQIDHIDRKNPKKVCFKFCSSNYIQETVDLYWNDGLEINARTLLDSLKMLKNRLYSQNICN